MTDTGREASAPSRFGALVDGAGKLVSNLLVYPLSRIWAREQGLWAFGAPGERFEGNSKYLYLWTHQHAPGVRPVWITGNRALARTLKRRGFEAEPRHSLRGLWAAARAAVFFVNDHGGDVNFGMSGGARLFNLWHGVGLKNVQRGASVGAEAALKEGRRNPLGYVRSMRRLQRPDLVLSTSAATSGAFFARCFDVPQEKAPALGYPRLDPLVDPELKALSLTFEDYSAFEEAAGRFSTVYLYAPTLRQTDSGLLNEAVPDLNRLSEALSARQAVLFLKLHPKTEMQKGWAETLPANIVLLPADLDPYPVLDRVDVLITDYSSLFYDFIAFKNSGVILYTFDFERYITRDRDLAWPFAENTVGVRADSFDALLDVIRSDEALEPFEPGKLASLREKFWDGPLSSVTASERIVRYTLALPEGDGGRIAGARRAHS